jgi:KRAB domain-containing zinc finger protein
MNTINTLYFFSDAGETPFHCQFCQKTFTRKEHKINHERKHQVDQQFKCEICDKSFTRKEHMTNHTLWHSG